MSTTAVHNCPRCGLPTAQCPCPSTDTTAVPKETRIVFAPLCGSRLEAEGVRLVCGLGLGHEGQHWMIVGGVGVTW